MIDFCNGEIKDILPRNLLGPEAEAVSFAIGEAMRRFQRYSRTSHPYAEIEQVPEAVLDLLAVEANTQYYSQTLPRKTKERLVMQTLVWYMHAGTPSVLDEFLATVMAGGYIEEWYQYSGDPYHFKAYARAYEDETIPPGYGTEIKRQLEIYKNTRSCLESLTFILTTMFPLKIGNSSQLHMRSDYYARNNRAFLLLDGSWELNGAYKLNGYKTISLDLYPARVKIRSEWTDRISAEWSMRTKANAGVEPKARTNLRIAGAATERPAVQTGLRWLWEQQTATEINCSLRVEKDLWYLDGSVLLDGTKMLDAEIFDYTL